MHGTPWPAVAAVTTPETGLEIHLRAKDLKSSHYEFQFDLAEQLATFCSTADAMKSLFFLVITERNSVVINREFKKKGVRNLTHDEEIDQSSFFKSPEFLKGPEPDPSTSRIKPVAEGKAITKKVKIFSRRKTNLRKRLQHSESERTSVASSNRFSALSDMTDDSQEDASDTGTLEYYVGSDESSTDSGFDDTDSEREEVVNGRLVVINKGFKKLRRKKRRVPVGIDEDIAYSAEQYVGHSAFYLRALLIIPRCPTFLKT